MRRNLGGFLAVLLVLAAAATALAHDLDHPAPTFSRAAPPSPAVIAGGEDAEWELLNTIPTGNPQTDLDFFTVKGITYMSVGSLAVGPNSAGQNIIKLTDEKGEVAPEYVTGHPSATCPKATSSATGLQHDSEASPKGQALVQFPNPHVVTSDTQIVVDATDATGRCHDQGEIGLPGAPPGGLEIIDVSDPANPQEIGLTTHVGMAHTVNIDPKRPHIAFVSSSDFVTYNDKGERVNEVTPCAVSVPAGAPCPQPGAPSSSLDGIEVVDMSTCMNFPEGANLQYKRDTCRPQVYRYRWPTLDFARSHTFRNTGGCHELEIYPDDRVACAAVQATLLLDLSGAFDDNGTPADYTDDKVRGTPLPCSVRDSSTAADPWKTGAKVIDCVVGTDGQDLRVQPWLEMKPSPPSLEGVEKLGAAHHMGFQDNRTDNFNPPYDAKTDVFVSHEAELTQSGRYLFATDERGGGVLPVGASCSPGSDNVRGNGGINAFRVDKLGAAPPKPGEPDNAELVKAYQEAIYATDSKGDRAIFRAPVETEPQGSVCTSHVLQQIPGQNRIFMGWYSQGTQVVDFTENEDGTIDFNRAGYFIPANANQWVSHVFKVQQNKDGSFTYWGATGDFALGDAGRNAIDIYKVTLPAPPKPRTASGDPPAGTPTFPVSDNRGVEEGADPPACASASGFDAVRARPRGKRVRFSFSRRSANGVKVEVMQKSRGRRIVGKRIAVFKNKKKAFTWSGKRAKDGYLQVRFTTKAPNGKNDVRHVGLRRVKGKFRQIGAFDRRESCALVNYFRVRSPVFGGKARRPLAVAFRLSQQASVSFVVRRGDRVVKRIKAKSYNAGGRRTMTVRLGRKAKRGLYSVTLKAERPGAAAEHTLFSRYL